MLSEANFKVELARNYSMAVPYGMDEIFQTSFKFHTRQ